jgi:hypothetical protein
MLIRWGEELAGHAGTVLHRATARVAARYAVSGAREEGALGLPSVFEVGLPALLAARAALGQQQRVDTLHTLMAHISDSNVYHRAGPQGAQIVRDHAERFLALGGTASAGWRARAIASHHVFIQHRLPPGGGGFAGGLLPGASHLRAGSAMSRARLLLLCPGQGDQHPDMFKLARTSPAASALADRLAATLPAESDIFTNRVAQPLIVAATLCMWEAIRGFARRSRRWWLAIASASCRRMVWRAPSFLSRRLRWQRSAHG